MMKCYCDACGKDTVSPREMACSRDTKIEYPIEVDGDIYILCRDCIIRLLNILGHSGWNPTSTPL